MHRSVIRVLLAAVATLATISASASDVDDVLARAKEATGGDAWDAVAGLHVEAAVAVGGLEGEIEGWEDLLTCRSASFFEIGPIRGAEGFDGEALWNRDKSGQVHVDDAVEAHRRAANQAWLRCLAYAYPERWPAETTYARHEDQGERTFHVLSVHPRGGRPFELWIDGSTHLVDRTVDPGTHETRTDTYSDYREVEVDGGTTVRVAFGLRSSNGQEPFDQVVTIRKVEARRELDDALFHLPESTVDDFTIADGATSAALDFELLNHHIYVEATVNGQEGFRFLVDTGGANVLTPQAVEKLGLRGEGSFEVRGVGEQTEEMSFTEVERLRLGAAELRDQVFFVIDMSELNDVGGGVHARVGRAGVLRLGKEDVTAPVMSVSEQQAGAFTDRHVAGNVGGGILKRFTVTFDYGEKQMLLRRNGLYGRPDSHDRAGLWLNRDGDAFAVMDVVPGGPAEDAGLRAGERVLAIDGRPVTELRLPSVRERLRSEPVGTKVKLRVAGEDGGERKVVLELRDLI